MNELPPKAQLVSDQPFVFREKEGGRSNYGVRLTRHENWKSDTLVISNGGVVRVDWPLTVTVMRNADKSDPLNQLRVYGVRVGDTLAFKMTFSAAAEEFMGPTDFERFIMAALVMIGVEHGSEIRDAIAAERKKLALAE